MSIVIAPSMSADHLQPPPHHHHAHAPRPPRPRPASMLSTSSSSSSSLHDEDLLSSPLIASMLFSRESLAASGGIPIGGLQDPAALRRALRSRTTSSSSGGFGGGYAPPFAPGNASPGSSGSRSPVSSRCSSSTSLATLAEEREVPHPRPLSRAGSSGETLVAPPMPIPLPGSSYTSPSSSSLNLPPPPPPPATTSARQHRRSSATTYTPGTRSKLSSSYSAEGGVASSPDLINSVPDEAPTKAMGTAALSASDKDRERSMLRRIGRTLRSLSISGRKKEPRKSIPAFVEVAAT